MRGLLVLALVGCASAGTRAPDPSPPPMQKVLIADQRLVTTSLPGNARVVVKATPDKVWPALLKAYAALGVTIEILDRPTGRVGNARFQKMHRFAGQPLSKFLNCGNTFSGPAADSYRMTLGVLSTMRTVSDGTEIETQFSAEGQNIEGASHDPVSCASTGALEERLKEILDDYLRAG
jgi:hypothetical protein